MEGQILSHGILEQPVLPTQKADQGEWMGKGRAQSKRATSFNLPERDEQAGQEEKTRKGKKEEAE